jgi:hypothetical protein
MRDKETSKSKQPKAADAREDRLKAALKANLARRKAQAKARKTGSDTDQGS